MEKKKTQGTAKGQCPAPGAHGDVCRHLLCGAHVPDPDRGPVCPCGQCRLCSGSSAAGRLAGGLAGAIGMGLNDLFFYPSSVIKTLVLKLGIGLFTGLIFHYGRTHPNRSPRVGLGVASVVSLASGAVVLGIYLQNGDYGNKLLIPSIFLLILGGVLAVVQTVSFFVPSFFPRYFICALRRHHRCGVQCSGGIHLEICRKFANRADRRRGRGRHTGKNPGHVPQRLLFGVPRGASVSAGPHGPAKSQTRLHACLTIQALSYT